MTDTSWPARVAALWDESDELGDNILLERMDALVAERSVDDAEAAYEAGSVRDSIGLEAEAVPYYERALELGLGEPHLSELYIQFASTLRNLGRYDEALTVLDRLPADTELADAAAATRALILVSAGRPVEGAAVAITALTQHMTRFKRSMANYAAEL
ncbi:MAG TPA: tetratricopeptide repeat protein [Galbitalea sp.]|jgi:lipoprotein NlpI